MTVCWESLILGAALLVYVAGATWVGWRLADLRKQRRDGAEEER